MRSNRIPDRVHVVRPPEQDGATRDPRMVQIVRTLAQISDKLKRSEAERYELLREMREYRKTLGDMEERNAATERNYKSLLKEIENRNTQIKSEQAKLLVEMERRKKQVDQSYLALEDKFKSREKIDSEISQRQARFERAVREAENKLVKAAAGQTLIEQRLKDADDKYATVHQRLDETISEQARLDRVMEKTAQEKARIYRKVERLEEIAMETKESLQAKAMVLLTDQSTAAQSGLPRLGASEDISYAGSEPWWRSAGFQGAAMMALVVGALLSGWAINQIQQPRLAQMPMPQSQTASVPTAAPDEFALTTPDLSDFEAIDLGEVTVPETLDIQDSELVLVDPPVEQAPIEQTPAAQEVLNASDEELLAAMEADPDALAAQMNEIAPAARQALDLEEAPTPEQQFNFSPAAFVQESKIEQEITAQNLQGTLESRITPDQNLPESVAIIEMQALAGNAEAQHDLAAIYTAGHAGVAQNFDRAVFWFREASNAGIANAQYNLGVLNHQGLGIERSLDHALYWYREAARRGHPEAQYNLGIAHIEGIGTTYNPTLAAEFFEASANQGVMEAAYNLGLIHENGLMGEAKPEQALMWYKIAADQGSPDARSAMEQLAASLQIGLEDVDRLVERMQQINISETGRRAGPEGIGSAPESRAAVDSMTEEQILISKIQELLKEAELYPGPADGIMGPQTADAIRSYQRTNNMDITGEPSDALLSHMIRAN